MSRISLIVGILLVPLALWATTPSLTSVSGTITTGQTLTISGTTLMDEDTTSWKSMYKTGDSYGFEGSGFEADGYEILNSGTGQVYDSTVKLSGSKSAKFHIEGASSGCPGGNLYSSAYVYNGDGAQDNYIRFYARWNSYNNLWASSHIKMLDNCCGADTQYYFQPHAGSTLPSTFDLHDGVGEPTAVNIPSGTLENGRWYCFEARFKTTAPYNVTAWIDGQQLASWTPSLQATNAIIMFGIINACETTSAFNLDHWVDNFAISTSRIYPSSKIEIGNNSDYATATKVYQAPVSLSDTSIAITADLTGLGDGPYYLWVTNNKQERSSAYLLGSESDTTPPTCTGCTGVGVTFN